MYKRQEVIGLVMQDYGNEEDQTTLTALSISELKQLIEKLSNNQDIPYIGPVSYTHLDVYKRQH